MGTRTNKKKKGKNKKTSLSTFLSATVPVPAPTLAGEGGVALDDDDNFGLHLRSSQEKLNFANKFKDAINRFDKAFDELFPEYDSDKEVMNRKKREARKKQEASKQKQQGTAVAVADVVAPSVQVLQVEGKDDCICQNNDITSSNDDTISTQKISGNLVDESTSVLENK